MIHWSIGATTVFPVQIENTVSSENKNAGDQRALSVLATAHFHQFRTWLAADFRWDRHKSKLPVANVWVGMEGHLVGNTGRANGPHVIGWSMFAATLSRTSIVRHNAMVILCGVELYAAAVCFAKNNVYKKYLFVLDTQLLKIYQLEYKFSGMPVVNTVPYKTNLYLLLHFVFAAESFTDDLLPKRIF